MSKLGEVFFSLDKIIAMHDSTEQIWQTLSLQVEDLSQKVNLKKCHDLALPLWGWRIWYEYHQKTQIFGRSWLDNHVIYYGQVSSL